MNRLQLELNRLHPDGAQSTPGEGPGQAVARQDGVRVLVLQLARPEGWERLSLVWQGLQSELELPPPAIAVSGVDGLQLWFFLAAPVSQRQGAAFLEGLRARYLPDVDPSRVRLLSDAADVPPVPPVETSPERWSAFVTPDLAAVFDDTPWLDIPPTHEGQATLLRILQPVQPAAFEAALKRLDPVPPGDVATTASCDAPGSPTLPASDPALGDPAGFLVGVMKDGTAPLALRVEAAKALLPYTRRS